MFTLNPFICLLGPLIPLLPGMQVLSTLIALMLSPGSPHSLCKAVVVALGNIAACGPELASAVVAQQALDPLTRLVSDPDPKDLYQPGSTPPGL